MLKEVLDTMGIHRLEYEGFEADDLIGTLAFMSEERSLDVYVATGDKDSLQLVTEFIRVLYHGTRNQKVYTPAMVEEEFGISPKQVPDHKGLMGDNSDNIPGVPGVGKVTATKLLQQFKTIENLVQNTEEITNKRIRGLVEEHTDSAIMSKRLATIITHVPMEFELEELKIAVPDIDGLVNMYKNLDSQVLSQNFKEIIQKQSRQLEYYIHNVKAEEDVKNLLEAVEKSGEMALHIGTDKTNIRTDNIVVLAISTDVNTCWCVDGEVFEQHIELFKSIFENANIKKSDIT